MGCVLRYAQNGFNISSGLGSQVKKLLTSTTTKIPGEPRSRVYTYDTTLAREQDA